GIFAPRIQPSKMVDLGGKSTAEALQAIHRWMCARLSYKQVYLSPERGWVPETGPEVVRRGYGDCKDLTTCFLGEVKGLGQGVYPALARIIDGAPETDDPVGPIFNHVISAIHLEKSLGFHSEVETSAGRLLLVDPTDRLTPLGWLGVQHLGHRVLVCMEKGGVWVDIPDGAILRPSTEVRLEGEVAASGRLAAILTLKETGDHLGLRGQALLRGKDELKQRLSAEFELPPTAKLELVRSGEPLDLTHPFEVVVKIEDSDGFHHAGSEASLASWGLPRTPALIQKTGQPRRFPVSVDTFSELDYSARIITDQPVSPVVPELKVETALRSLDWSAKVLTEQGRNQLDLHFHQARKPAHFGFGEQEKGVAEAKKDRRAMQAFRADALAFKVQP
ncbi:MAG TPA: hypothetical protein VJ483_09220, partial [Holophagaceae bacterium]|nr:hypothetical protein [Holophagaceae bacterium]